MYTMHNHFILYYTLGFILYTWSFILYTYSIILYTYTFTLYTLSFSSTLALFHSIHSFITLPNPKQIVKNSMDPLPPSPSKHSKCKSYLIERLRNMNLARQERVCLRVMRCCYALEWWVAILNNSFVTLNSPLEYSFNPSLSIYCFAIQSSATRNESIHSFLRLVY